jgi:ABC-type branched-subunit amino acid transport system substrate-binding protein
MTKTGTNRVVIASDSEAFANDAVRNLNLIVHNKFNLVLYAPAKIRTFETIEVENFHNTSLHASLTYHIDYESKDVKDFILKYRAMFGAEPTQFAFQGYDIARHFIEAAAEHKEWQPTLEGKDTPMLQSNFMFRKNGQGGHTNNGVRRIIYGKDYSIKTIK